jgi:hypothetical protein
MKATVITLLSIILSGTCYAQEFSLVDSVVKVGSLCKLRTFVPSATPCVGIHYDHEEYYYESEIIRIKKFLDLHPTVVLEIGAHTDLRGTEDFHLALSIKHVEYIFDKLTGLGIKPERLVANGYGEQNPIYTQQFIDGLKTEQEKEEFHQKNRRIELKILRL